jgi:predicted small secreted protein
MNLVSKARLTAAGIATVLAFSAAVGTAHAMASYDPYTGTNPHTTGCAADAITIATRTVSSPQAYYGTMDVRYSPTCGTNWVRANIAGNSTTIEVVKIIKRYSSQPDGHGGWLGYYSNHETDIGAGSSFGMQVYAPGATCIEAGVAVYYNGTLAAYTGTPEDITPTFC